MPYLVTVRTPDGLTITTLPPVHSRAAALAKLVEHHGPLVLTHRIAGTIPFVYQFEDGTAATIKESSDEHNPTDVPA